MTCHLVHFLYFSLKAKLRRFIENNSNPDKINVCDINFDGNCTVKRSFYQIFVFLENVKNSKISKIMSQKIYIANKKCYRLTVFDLNVFLYNQNYFLYKLQI